MAYLGRNLERRSHPERVLPGARTVLCVGMNYDQENGAPFAHERATGRISRYARGDDYHDLMNARLEKLLAWIQTLDPDVKGRVYVDTGPVLERDFAARAGIGWFGKHTNLIHKRRGSWFFLGEILADPASGLRPPRCRTLRDLHAVYGRMPHRCDSTALRAGFQPVHLVPDD